MKTDEPTKVETKQIKHDFTLDERDVLGATLARTVGELRGIQAEFDQVKAGFKARTTEAEAKIDKISTDRVNGFEYRMEKCVVQYRPKDRKKDYYLETAWSERNGALPPVVLTEDMNRDDYQSELVLAESKFSAKDEIELFPRTESDFGTLIVGQFAGKWFSALRVRIGKLELNERLDSEQPCAKLRSDAVKRGVKRVTDWAKENMKDHAKGFEDSFRAVVEAHKERAE